MCVTLRDITALSLCRAALEDYSRKANTRCAVTPENEVITIDSTIEVFDELIETLQKI